VTYLASANTYQHAPRCISLSSARKEDSWPHARARASFKCKATRYFHRRMYRASQICRHRVHDDSAESMYMSTHVCVRVCTTYVYVLWDKNGSEESSDSRLSEELSLSLSLSRSV